MRGGAGLVLVFILLVTVACVPHVLPQKRAVRHFYGLEKIEPLPEWCELWDRVRDCIALQGEPVRDRAIEDYTWFLADSIRVGTRTAYGYHDEENWTIYLDRRWYETMGTTPHEIAHAHLANRETYHPETIFRERFFLTTAMQECLNDTLP